VDVFSAGGEVVFLVADHLEISCTALEEDWMRRGGVGAELLRVAVLARRKMMRSVCHKSWCPLMQYQDKWAGATRRHLVNKVCTAVKAWLTAIEAKNVLGKIRTATTAHGREHCAQLAQSHHGGGAP
jgi:hypothetical protein